MKKPDFGDILEKWESGSANSQKNIMDEWLQDKKIHDKDYEINKISNSINKRRYLHQKKPDDILDIHGQTGEEALYSLECFFSNARENNYRKLRIIHGKGNHTNGAPTLGITVRNYIEKCPFAGESGFEKPVNGGSGATWVLIK